MSDARPGFSALPAAFLAICVIVALGIAASWKNPGIGQDEGLLLEYPQLIAHGKVPFRDFQSSYGPGTYLPLVVAYQALGPSLTVERAVGAAYRVAVILAIAALLAPLGGAVMLCGASLTLAGILGPGPPTTFGWYGALACALWAVWLARSALRRGAAVGPARQHGADRTHWRWAGTGVLIGLTISVRPDLGAAALIASLVLVAGAGPRGRWSFAAGVAGGLIPVAWNLAAAGVSAVWLYFVESRLHTQTQAGIPLSSEAGLLAILVAATAAVLVAAIAEWRRAGPGPMSRAWLALAVLSVLLLPQYLQRPDAGHFAFVAPVVLGLLAWALSSVPSLSALTRVALPTALALGVAVHAGARALAVKGYAVRDGGRSFVVAAGPDRDQLQAVVAYLQRHATTGQRIFVGPLDLRWALWADTSLYYLLPRLRPASFYLEMGPGDNTPRFTARVASDLKRAQILVLQLIPTATRLTIYPYARPGSNLPNTIVARSFRLSFRSGAYSVFLRAKPFTGRAQQVPA